MSAAKAMGLARGGSKSLFRAPFLVVTNKTRTSAAASPTVRRVLESWKHQHDALQITNSGERAFSATGFTVGTFKSMRGAASKGVTSFKFARPQTAVKTVSGAFRMI